MIAVVEQVKQELTAPYKAVCRELGVPRSSLMRWKSRQLEGKAVVGRPGPAKVGPLDFKALHDEIRNLKPCRLRTPGTGELYDKYSDVLSRRDFHALVEAVRREMRQEELALQRRVEWLVPGAVWSMDDTKKHWLEDARFGHMHLVLDLGSRYNLRALGDEEQARGELVASNLKALFDRHGAPLFMKMDGGSNFKHHEVRDLCAERGVIPLVSPQYYPPYNGSVEREHQELLRHLARRTGAATLGVRELVLACEVAGHEVNHMRRPCLGDRTACCALEEGRPAVRRFGRRERKEVFEEIKTLAVDIAGQLEEHTNLAAETAFRYAAETWMQSNNIIRVTRNGEVLPPFYQFWSH
jgi:transposase InsO family protein